MGRGSRKGRVTADPGRPLTAVPVAPENLGTFGTRYWNRIAPLLVQLRLLTDLHLESLEALCEWWDEFRTKTIYLRENPEQEFFTTDSGYEQRSPRAIARDKAYESLLKLWSKFGLTPDALKRLTKTTGARDEDNEIEDFAAQKYADDSEDSE